MLRSVVGLAASALIVALAGCAPTFAEPEVLPIFAEEQEDDDIAPEFVLDSDYGLRPASTRYIGASGGFEVFVGLADVMGSPTNTCIVTILDAETWMSSCSPELPLTATPEGGPTFVLHWPGDPEPEGSFEALGDYVWVQPD